MSQPETSRPPYALAIFLVVAGAIGWLCAFALTLEKFQAYEHPQSALACDFSVLVQCTKNLESPEGSAFGFPNPIIGLGGFVAPIAVGVALLAGARFARWFWIAFNVGLAGALAFVVWLIAQSVFVLGTLCPYCMVVWSVTIPLFLVVTLRNLRAGVFGLGPGARRLFATLYTWVPAITLACYLVVAIVAQARLDVLHSI